MMPALPWHSQILYSTPRTSSGVNDDFGSPGNLRRPKVGNSGSRFNLCARSLYFPLRKR